ncbi:MAG: hypothetical protein ACYTEW_27165 [Planctomycetota bacterium]|jgi:hypothetical protein
MNTYTNTTVNGKEINKQETENKSRWGRFLCEVNINGKIRRQWTNNLINHIQTCNENEWEIEGTTWFVAPPIKEIPANHSLYNSR